ncbi:MFS transporter [Fructilactobacillus myrtifloralis]|uniref:MFS transporter n=1 Tax=Fructilactobacillus myrtifloralis TaxID=2940301 RepID=A0ABY5BR98_9LACO|nr:MFS transporter [Fructilactobacillus myrtifloralis]USS85711.1 MFS transporter [Fructilactobacillus myrtifloralis]
MTMNQRTNKPTLATRQLWYLTIGFLGAQGTLSMQTGNMSRIFQTLGADPTKLGYFFILPPLAGMLVQPLVGYLSDRSWFPKLGGRRLPYLILGTIISVIAMVLLPNAGSLGFGYRSLAALWFGAVSVFVMDCAANVNLSVYKMLIPDIVPKQQQSEAWDFQSITGALGNVLAFLFPFLLTVIGVANVAPQGVVPASVQISFYAAAVILLVSTLFTLKKVHEYPPEVMASFTGHEVQRKRQSLGQIIRKAPSQFWSCSLVMFFGMFALQYMWTYTPGVLAQNIWHSTNPASSGYQAAGNWFGVLQAIMAVAGIGAGIVISKLKLTKHRKPLFLVSSGLGGIGYLLLALGTTRLLTIIAFILIGIQFVTIQVVVFSLFTNSLDGKNDGLYTGLFNVSICLPQIVASLASFGLFNWVQHDMASMLIIASGAVFVAGLCIYTVKDPLQRKAVG